MKETLSSSLLCNATFPKGRGRHQEQFAAGCVVLTTLLSIVTLPLCALVLTALM